MGVLNLLGRILGYKVLVKFGLSYQSQVNRSSDKIHKYFVGNWLCSSRVLKISSDEWRIESEQVSFRMR